MADLKITSLFVYPVKGCKGISLSSAEVTRTGLSPQQSQEHQRNAALTSTYSAQFLTIRCSAGLAYDRHWCVVAEGSGKFITQRSDPKMALIETSLPREALEPEDGGALPAGAALVLSYPDKAPLAVSLVPQGAGPGRLHDVTVWEWSGQAQDEGDAAAAWLSDVLQKPCRLVRYVGEGAPALAAAAGAAGAQRRPCEPEFAPGYHVAFSDGFPLLLASEASLASVESLAEQPLRMNRFRPNIVVSGCGAFEEDAWASLSTGRAREGGPIRVVSVKPCSRCEVTTIEQETGQRGRQPLMALKGSRTGRVLGWSKKEFRTEMFFGWNAVTENDGYLSVGDSLTVLGKREAM